MEETSPLKSLQSFSPLRNKSEMNNSLNSSFVIVSGLGEIDDDLEQMQKDLRRAERGIYLSEPIDSEFQDSVVIGSPTFQKKGRNRSVKDIQKPDESILEQLSHLERENYNLNSDVLSLTKEKKKLVKEIYEKNQQIRDIGRNQNISDQKSSDFQQVRIQLQNLKEENIRLSQQLLDRDTMLTTLKLQMNARQDGTPNEGNQERIQQYLSGMEEERAKLSNSEEFLNTQIRNLKMEIAKLRETQKKSLELTTTQQQQFEEQKQIDSQKIRNMKERYETKFEDVKREYVKSFKKIKEEYMQDIEKYGIETEEKDKEIHRLRNILRKVEKNRSTESIISSSSDKIEKEKNKRDDDDDDDDEKLEQITSEGSEEGSTQDDDDDDF